MPDSAQPRLRFLVVSGAALPIHDAPVPAQWQARAAEIGYTIAARVKDRYHLAIRCHACDTLSVCKVFVLRSGHPACPECLEAGWRAKAAAAGLRYLGRDPAGGPYLRLGLPCGHEASRQLELLDRAARGLSGIRCEICHAEREAEEARAIGWTLVGPDPRGDASYRLYRHDDCGHLQRVARANVQTARFGCGACDPGWVSARNYLYAMRFALSDGTVAVKFGHSRNPDSRLRHQLVRDLDQEAALLGSVAVPSGHLALIIEKRLHTALRRIHPAAVLPPERFADRIRVKTEIYDAALEPVILRMLARVARLLDRRGGV